MATGLGGSPGPRAIPASPARPSSHVAKLRASLVLPLLLARLTSSSPPPPGLTLSCALVLLEGQVGTAGSRLSLRPVSWTACLAATDSQGLPRAVGD